MRTLIHNAANGWVLVDGNTIADCGAGQPPSAYFHDALTMDAAGRILMPGVIDPHVHMRQPGLTHKADMASESRAAVAGGVTSVLDMPNCVPPTTTNEAVAQKQDIAATQCIVNHAFYIGATNSNIDELASADYTQVPGIKLFLGSSTGNMLVDGDDAVERIFKLAAQLRVPVTVHAEDEATIAEARRNAIARHGSADAVPVHEHTALRPAEACIRATQRALQLAARYGTRLNVAHLTTWPEMQAVLQADSNVVAEVAPQHLWFTDQDYEKLGSRIKINPAVKDADNRSRLLAMLPQGANRLMMGSDHAPHLLSEKEGGAFKAASGAPMIQYALPLMLDILQDIELVSALTSGNPARNFGIERRGAILPGNYADIVLVEKVPQGYTVSDADTLSLCGWTPLHGTRLHHRVTDTWVNGHHVYANGTVAANAPAGHPLHFRR